MYSFCRVHGVIIAWNYIACYEWEQAMYSPTTLLVPDHIITCFQILFNTFKCSFSSFSLQFSPGPPVHRCFSWKIPEATIRLEVSAVMPMNREFREIWKNGKNIFSKIAGVKWYFISTKSPASTNIPAARAHDGSSTTGRKRAARWRAPLLPESWLLYPTESEAQVPNYRTTTNQWYSG